jgi:hypothetical protein
VIEEEEPDLTFLDFGSGSDRMRGTERHSGSTDTQK